jgi:uncharacterized membrane protein YhaH (DUF805 family)
MEWMLMPLRRYADFSGRSRRLEFWMFQLLNVIVVAVFMVLILASIPWGEIGEPGAAQPEQPGPLFWVGVLLATVWGFGTIIPSIAVQVRRFHDQDKTGWLWLLNFLPFGGFIVLVFMFIEGTPGENSYGPDPKDPGSARAFD